ncbi:MAG: NUDIX hydrolase [Megasphaera sp.]|jgi:8-oxo-dGTP diphosphatase|nr:NUDIX hydrolase [Megasphaera sp.]MCI1248278.1 NUDIX hydrolase [Megasphaera sp.]
MEQNEKALMGMSVKAMIFHDGKLLLLQKNDAEGAHHWEFPGGGLGMNENLLMGLKREVREETGLDIHILAPAGTWHYQKKDGCFLNGLVFTATSDGEDVCLSDEHIDFCWIRPEELSAYRLHGSLWRALLHMKTFEYIKSKNALEPFLSVVQGEE